MDIRGASQPYTRDGSQSLHGLLSLQKLLLRDIFNEENPNINDVDRCINVIRNRIRSKRVLMILDDADHEKQLEKLVGKREWYCPGSRIVVTTRNEHVLNVYKIDKKSLKYWITLNPVNFSVGMHLGWMNQ
ncbi:TMV resistance protein N-like [Amborella trichopoda]|uniref:TMV resistance protein N-like n=1 Tax=Amborella trichopoda TaxID=13333 RepID=UPI0005D3E964|nr:TMV resistance protein N-like [Amborella trichopoda]|eukprot:XP_011622106.1 TMV resistance protein N-like [Amborella trichopoda]